VRCRHSWLNQSLAAFCYRRALGVDQGRFARDLLTVALFSGFKYRGKPRDVAFGVTTAAGHERSLGIANGPTL